MTDLAVALNPTDAPPASTAREFEITGYFIGDDLTIRRNVTRYFSPLSTEAL